MTLSEESDVEAGKSQLLDIDEDPTESVPLPPAKTSILHYITKQSILDMVNKSKF